mgnify:CR=1 FL=1
MLVFSFTTLIGNIYYCENGLAYLNHKRIPSRGFMKGFHLYAILVVFLGAIIPMAAAWDLADIMMGGMTLINLTACVLLGGVVSMPMRITKNRKRPDWIPSSKGHPSA